MEEREEEEDRLGSLIKLCEITPSQESKLENHPFTLESENFPDAVDSLPSQYSPNPPASEPPAGIIMVSPPESDVEEEGDEDKGSIDNDNPQETEEFQTPPEHHNRSTYSSQATPVIDVDEGVDGSGDVETVAIDTVRDENEVNLELEERGENLGFVETEELESEVEEIEGSDRGLKRFRGFEGELDERVSKRVRVWEENLDSEGQTMRIDEAEITEKVDGVDEKEDEELLDLDDDVNDEAEITEKVDDVDEEEGEEGLLDWDDDENDEEIGLDEGKTVIDLDSDEEESEGHDGGTQNVEMQIDVERVSEGQDDGEGETENVQCGHDDGVDNPGEQEGGDLDNGENYVMMNGGWVVAESDEGYRENEDDELSENGEGVSGGKNTEEIEKFNYTARNGDDSTGKEKGVGPEVGERSSLVNGDVVFEASEEGNVNNGNDEVQKSSEKALALWKIDQFRYNGAGDDGDQCSKEIVEGRRELPLSLREKGNNVGGKEAVGKMDRENLSWKELLEAVAVVLGKVDDGSEEVDFLEVAKRKGMTFPLPRWY